MRAQIADKKWVPLELDFKQLIKKSQSSRNQHISSSSSNISWSEKLQVCKKLNKSLRHFYFWLKYELSIHNIALSSEKGIVSESGEKYAQIKHSFVKVQTVQNSSKQI